MGNPDLIFTLAGIAALLAAVLPRLLNRLPFSLPLACLVGGFLLYRPAPRPARARSGGSPGAGRARHRDLRAHLADGRRAGDQPALRAAKLVLHLASPGMRRSR